MKDNHKPQAIADLLTTRNSEILPDTMRLSPIFNPDKTEIVFQRLIKHYTDEVVSRTGQQPRDLAFFEPKFKGLSNWICNTSSIKRGLIIGGSTGIGKTTITTAMRNLFNSTSYFGYTMQISAKYIGDYYRFREDGEKWDIYTGEKKVKRFNEPLQPICKILFIDDLGMEEDEYKDYGTKTQPMAKLLHDRYERGLITIVSTNLESMDELRQKYDDRIIDRLNSYAKMFYSIDSFRR